MIELVFVAILLILIIAYPFYARILRNYINGVKLVNKIPGPAGFPIVGPIFQIMQLPVDKRLRYLTKNFTKHGYILKLFAFPIHVVAIADADAIEAILSPRAEVNKGFAYFLLEPWLGKSLLTIQNSSKDSKWYKLRKTIAPNFNYAALNKVIVTFADQCEKLLTDLEGKLNDLDGFDICPYIGDFALRIVCENIIGLNSNDHSQKMVTKFSEHAKSSMEVAAYRLLHPWMWLNLIYMFTGTYRKQQHSVYGMQNITSEIINRKRKFRKGIDDNEMNLKSTKLEEKGGITLLDYLLDVNEKDKRLFSNDVAVRNELITFMITGYETTTITLSFTLFLLGLYQDIQEKVLAEIYEVFGSQPQDTVPTMSQLSQLKYMEKVMKESLRLFPPAAAIIKSTSKDVQIKNYTIPANTFVHVSIYHLHRNPLYYQNPDSFNPENFSEENIKARHPYAYVPFSAGPRSCIGQKYALLELKVALVMLLRKYKVTSFGKLEDVRVKQTTALHPIDGLRVRISERK